MSTAVAAPPWEVMIEFATYLAQVSEKEQLIPVLRGSVLMQHWYGARARPAADIDLEALLSADHPPRPARVDRYSDEGYGQDNAFESRLDWCKALCRYAAETSTWGWGDQEPGAIQFRPVAEMQQAEIAAMQTNGWNRLPADPQGSSLWTYNTPGERYFAAWQWRDRKLGGQLQIDIAESRAYGIADLDVRPITIRRTDGKSYQLTARDAVGGQAVVAPPRLPL